MADNFKENDDAKNKANKKGFKKVIIRMLLIIIPIILFVVIFICVIAAAVLIVMDIINFTLGSIGGSITIENNSKYWWPIGSNETTIVDGITYASGNPTPTSISSYFGYRDQPLAGATTNHKAIDIAGGVDGVTNIIAAKDGVVTKINTGCVRGNNSCGGRMGNYVYITHSDGSITRYIHLNTVLVNTNDKVKQGQVIGKMGSTGNSTGVHLDFQIQINGVPVNPLNYVSSEDPRPSSRPNNIQGNDNLQTICLTLKQYGYSDNAVAGILGNMKAESGFLPVNTNYLGCDGIVQWCFGRLTNLKNTYGNEWSNLNNQISYVVYELENSYLFVNKYLSESHSASEIAYHFCMNYEVPGESICASGTRQNYANDLLSYVQNGCN